MVTEELAQVLERGPLRGRAGGLSQISGRGVCPFLLWVPGEATLPPTPPPRAQRDSREHRVFRGTFLAPVKH